MGACARENNLKKPRSKTKKMVPCFFSHGEIMSDEKSANGLGLADMMKNPLKAFKSMMGGRKKRTGRKKAKRSRKSRRQSRRSRRGGSGGGFLGSRRS